MAFDRPLIVLSAPRSGSTLLFESLARAPGLYTIGGESHRAIEGIAALRPAARGFESNRLDAADATPAVVAQLRDTFASRLIDREGRPPAVSSVRFLEKTPKNCLRVPFLRAVFPDALFVVLHRDPRAVLASMIDAWQSGRFVTYPQLPGWFGPPWSLLLVPGWRELIGRPIEVIVAHQWRCTVDALLDALEPLPSRHVLRVEYDALVSEPNTELERLCDVAGLTWDRAIERLPLSRHTLTVPDPGKWRRHEASILGVLPSLQPTIERAAAFFAR